MRPAKFRLTPLLPRCDAIFHFPILPYLHLGSGYLDRRSCLQPPRQSFYSECGCFAPKNCRGRRIRFSAGTDGTEMTLIRSCSRCTCGKPCLLSSSIWTPDAFSKGECLGSSNVGLERDLALKTLHPRLAALGTLFREPPLRQLGDP